MPTELLTDRAPLADDDDRAACLRAASDPARRPTPRGRGGHAPEAVERVIARAVAVLESDRLMADQSTPTGSGTEAPAVTAAKVSAENFID
jgi:hypothetical protein